MPRCFAGLLGLALVIASPSSARTWDVKCPDGTRYMGTSTPPCVELCANGSYAVRGESECPTPTPYEKAHPGEALKAQELATSSRSSGYTPAGLIVGGLFLLVAFLVYFLPAFVASSRGHPNVNAIGMLNFLLGWTALGWIIALVWALTAIPPTEEKPRETP